MPTIAPPYYLHPHSPGVVIITDNEDDPTYQVAGRLELGGYAWKLDIGAECNALLNLADGFERGEIHPYDSLRSVSNNIADILRSSVERIASFEKLEPESALEAA